MERTYEIVYFKISSICREKDDAITQASHRLQHLDLCHFSLPQDFGPALLECVKVI